MKIKIPLGLFSKQKKFQALMNNLLRNLLRGVIVISPLVVTLMAVIWLFNIVDSFLPNLIQHILDIIFNYRLKAPSIPGLGFIAVILLLALIGYISNFFIFNKMMKFLDAYFEKAPGIKFVYTTLKDLVKNLSGSKKNFDKPVLVSLDNSKNLYRMGFITQTSLSQIDLHDFVAVYIPMSFSIAGNVYFVSKQNIKLVNNIDSAAAMKFLISGGVTNLNTPPSTEKQT